MKKSSSAKSPKLSKPRKVVPPPKRGSASSSDSERNLASARNIKVRHSRKREATSEDSPEMTSTTAPPHPTSAPTQDQMSFLGHLFELRKFIIRALIVLIVGIVIGFILYEPTVVLLSKPFAALATFSDGQQLYVNSILEGFMVKMKLSFLLGVILTFPIQIFLFLRFLFPALEPKEKRLIFYTLISSSVLILISVYYSYGEILPLSVEFLTGSGFLPENVGVLLGYSSNIFFVFQFILVTLVLFQFPVVLELLMVMNVLKRKTMVKSSRFFVIGIVVTAAIITPPDPISLVTIALPLIGMFYATLLIAKVFRLGE